MKRILATWILASAVTLACGQYVPGNGQAFQFSSLTNPAFSGIESFGDLRLSYRHQWAGFGSYSPTYLNLAYDMRLKNPVDLTRNSVRVSRPSAVQPENLPRRTRIIHGLGVNAFQSSVGVINTIGGSVAYAFNYPLSPKLRLSVGAATVLESRRMKLGDITFNEPDPFYNHLLGSATSQTDLSVRTGFLVYSQNFYFGASYLPLMNTSIRSSEVAMEKPFYRASFQGGVSFPVNPTLDIKPSILAYMVLGNEFTLDYNVKAYLENRGWVGLTYRDTGTGILMVGMYISPIVHASYSYEVGFAGFQSFGGSSHELVVGLRLNNLRKEKGWVW